MEKREGRNNIKIKHTINITKTNGKLTSTAQGAESFALRKKGNSVAICVLLRSSTFLLTPDPDPVLFFIERFYWVSCIIIPLRVHSYSVSQGMNKQKERETPKRRETPKKRETPKNLKKICRILPYSILQRTIAKKKI